LFQCGFGSSFFPSMRITQGAKPLRNRIRFGSCTVFCCHKKLNFCIKNILSVENGNGSRSGRAMSMRIQIHNTGTVFSDPKITNFSGNSGIRKKHVPDPNLVVKKNTGSRIRNNAADFHFQSCVWIGLLTHISLF
jgi:hypothetical protein